MKPNSTRYVIEAENLTRIYTLGDSEVIGINAVDLRIAAGELVVLKGNSGSGKSTLLSLLAGLDHPTGGKLTVAEHDLTKATSSDLTLFRREIVGMVFQSFNLMPTLNVLENACLPGLLAGKKPSTLTGKARKLLNWLGLNQRLTHLPAQLSGGEMQRAAIARALIAQPKVLLADEPTGNLDGQTGREILDILRSLNRRENLTIVMVTHDDSIARQADRTVRLIEGRVEE